MNQPIEHQRGPRLFWPICVHRSNQKYGLSFVGEGPYTGWVWDAGGRVCPKSTNEMGGFDLRGRRHPILLVLPRPPTSGGHQDNRLEVSQIPRSSQ